MAQVNQFATWFSTGSAGPGSIVVRADVGFSSLCGPARADRSSVPTLPQCLNGQSRRFDDHTLST
jgi:hypothetical protein